MVKCLLPVYDESIQFLIYVQTSLQLYPQQPTCIPSSISSSKSTLSSPNISSIFLSILLLSVLTTIFAVCAMRLILQWSLHFVAFHFFFKAIIETSGKSLGPSPAAYTLLRICVSGLRPSSPSSLISQLP